MCQADDAFPCRIRCIWDVPGNTNPITERVNLALSSQFINLTNTPILSVPASWWGQYSSCVACNGIRTTGLLGGGSGAFENVGLLDGSYPGRQIEMSLNLNFWAKTAIYSGV